MIPWTERRAVIEPRYATSGRRFAGFTRVTAALPDETTLLKFRHRLIGSALTAPLRAAINGHLNTQGMLISQSTRGDATIIHAPRSTKNTAGERDPKMHQTKKGNPWYFGRKIHVGAEVGRQWRGAHRHRDGSQPGYMKTFLTILILILSQQVVANNSCFEDSEIKELIKISKALDKCFNGKSRCGDVSQLSIWEQKERNILRLVPFDRTQDDLMNKATGVVSITFGEYDGNDSGQQFQVSGQKISRCHIVTSAHLLYSDGRLPVESENFKIKFFSGQTCDPEYPFASQTSGKVVFKMMRKGTDYKCQSVDRYGNCEKRRIDGHSDLVIIKLDKFDRNDRDFFTVNSKKPSDLISGQKVNCWGYPGYHSRSEIRLSREKSDMLLWAQKEAQIFTGKGFKSSLGILTNAISYKGMSGGGCAMVTNPGELVGAFSNNNGVDGHSAIALDPKIIVEQGPNHLSGFHRLHQRYSQAHGGKKLSDLDAECDKE